MTFQAFDMIGQEIIEGDLIVYAISNGSSATLRLGRVIKKKVVSRVNQPSNYYLTIEWIEGLFLPKKPSNISITPDSKSHILKVELNGFKQN